MMNLYHINFSKLEYVKFDELLNIYSSTYNTLSKSNYFYELECYVRFIAFVAWKRGGGQYIDAAIKMSKYIRGRECERCGDSVG